MFLRIAAAFSLMSSVLGGNGPSSLYTLLNGQTFNPPGYTIVMYQSCMQNQNSGNPCGSFSTFQSSNGQYTKQLYGPAPCSGSCCRQFELTLACGPTMSMSGVNENPICNYAATLTLPEVCGVDMTVGNEAASKSPSAPPPTPTATATATATHTTTQTASSTQTTTQTPTQSMTSTETATQTATQSSTQTSTQSVTDTATQTATQTATESATITSSGTTTGTSTSTPLFVITAFPTTTSTMTLTATATSLFMITAWPTTSPVNVSATSTPLYYMTPYPSYNPNNASAPLSDLVATAVAAATSNTGTILGAVGVGLVGIGAAAYAINYLRKGGSVSGLIEKVKSEQATIQKVVKDLPISDSLKQNLQNPSALVNNAISTLPLSSDQKSKLQSLVPTNLEELQNDLQHPEQLKQQVISMATSEAVAALPPALQSLASPVVTQAVADVASGTPISQIVSNAETTMVQITQAQLAELLANQASPKN